MKHKDGKFTRPIKSRKPKKIFVIATEGEKTEDIYFSIFRTQHYDKVIIKVLPALAGKSAPKHLIKRIQQYKKDHNLKDNYELWIVVDVDQQAESLDEICSRCKKLGINIAVSNPNFEIWLSFHQEKSRTPQTSEDCMKEVKQLLKGYTKARYDVHQLIPYIQAAIDHAKRLDGNPDDAWTREPGSRVYVLVERIMAAQK